MPRVVTGVSGRKGMEGKRGKSVEIREDGRDRLFRLTSGMV
jgi:hypothetical protein